MIAAVALAGSTAVQALHVTQWQDSMTILPGHFIELINSNEQSVLSAAVDNKTNIKQDFSIDLVRISKITMLIGVSSCPILTHLSFSTYRRTTS